MVNQLIKSLLFLKNYYELERKPNVNFENFAPK